MKDFRKFKAGRVSIGNEKHPLHSEKGADLPDVEKEKMGRR